jgi:hypothetical protein
MALNILLSPDKTYYWTNVQTATTFRYISSCGVRIRHGADNWVRITLDQKLFYFKCQPQDFFYTEKIRMLVSSRVLKYVALEIRT